MLRSVLLQVLRGHKGPEEAAVVRAMIYLVRYPTRCAQEGVKHTSGRGGGTSVKNLIPL